MNTAHSLDLLQAAGLPSVFHLSINGKLVDADRSFDVLNPATNEVIAKAPQASA